MRLHLPLPLLGLLLSLMSLDAVHSETISANKNYTANAELTETTTIGANGLTVSIQPNVVVTQATGGFNVGDNNLTINGGGVLKLNTEATEIISSSVGNQMKTLTLDNATLDISNPNGCLNGVAHTFTRLYLTVKNNGVLKVNSFQHDGSSLNGIATNPGYFKLDNGSIEISNANDSKWEYGLSILSGGGTVKSMVAGKTVNIEGANSTNDIGRGAALTLDGVGNFNIVAGQNNKLTGAGKVVKKGAGTLTISADQNFQGGIELKEGTLIAGSVGALGSSKSLLVSGNSTLGGLSSALSRLTLNNGVSLNVGAVDDNNGLSFAGRLELKGTATITGPMGIKGNSNLVFALVPGTTPFLDVNGVLSLSGNLYMETGNASVTWESGKTYNIISADSITGGFANSVRLSNAVYGKWVVDAVNNSLNLVTYDMKFLSWAGGGNSVWALNGSAADSPWTDGGVYDNDTTVTFGNIARKDSETVTITGAVTPLSIIVNADSTNYSWRGDGSIDGATTLLKEGDGTLSIFTSNTYSGDTIVKKGILEMGHANALGTGNILLQGGTFKYGAGIVADISSRLADGSAANRINIDLNSNAVTWATWKNFLNLTNTGADEGMLTLTANSSNLTVALGANTVLKVTSANNADTKDNSVSLSGSGKFIVANTDNTKMGIGSLAGFTGELVREQTGGSAALLLTTSNTESDRFDLTINGSSYNQSVILGGSNGFSTGATLYIRNLSGTSDITTSYNSGITNRGFNIEMTRDNAYSGNFHTANTNGDLRWGTVTIGSKAGDPIHSFIWTGHSRAASAYNSLGANAKLVINNAVVDFASNADKTKNGGWFDDILINNGGTLRISRTDTDGFVHNQGISGDGRIVIAGNATFNAANTLTGGITLESGTLTLGNVDALGAGNVNFEGGVLNINGQALAKALTIDSGKSGGIAGASAYTGALTVNGRLNIGAGTATETMNVGNLTTGAGGVFVFDLNGANSDKIVINQNSTLTFGTGTQILLELSAMPAGTTTYDFIVATANGITINGKNNLTVNDSILVRGFTATGVWGGDGNNVYQVTISGAASAGSAVWNGGVDGQWSAGGRGWSGKAGDGTTDITDFRTGDHVTFTTRAGITNDTVKLMGTLLPADVKVSGTTNYTFEGTGVLGGTTTLTKEGTGSLTISTANTYSGNTSINGGILVMANDKALGTGTISFGGGILKYGSGITTDISARIAEGTVTNRINIDLNGNNVTWANRRDFLNLTNTGAGEGVLTLSVNPTNLTVSLGEKATLNATVANGTSNPADSITLSGAGKFIAANTDNAIMGIGSLSGFTGEIVRNQTNTGNNAALLLTSSNTINDRFDLTINGSSMGQAVIVGANAGFATGATLYLRNLSGEANMTTSYNTNTNRNLNIEMTRDNAYSGNFHTANTNGDLRWGTVTIGSKAGDPLHSFIWTGYSLAASAYNSLGANAKLVINNAIVDFGSNADKTKNGGWFDDILINNGGTLRISRTDTDGFVHNQGISGDGRIVIAGNATFNAANTLTGGITIESGTLTLGHTEALGAGKVTVSGGTLNINNQAVNKELTITSGSLSNAGSFLGKVIIDQSKASVSSNIDLGGVLGGRISSIKSFIDVANDKSTTVSNIGSGTITLSGEESLLGITSDMISDSAGNGNKVIRFADGASGSLVIDGKLAISLTDAAATELINGLGSTQYISIVNGTLTLGKNGSINVQSPYHVFQNIYNFGNVAGGDLVLNAKQAGKSGWLIVASNDPGLTIDSLSKDILPLLKGIYNDGIITLDASLGNADLINLEGASSNGVVNLAAGTTVTLINKDHSDSIYHGTISGSANLIKGGTDYNMTIGRLNLTDGASLSVEGGGLTLNNGGAGSSSLIDGDLSLSDSASFVLAANHTATINGIIRSDATANSITLNQNSILNFGNDLELNVGIEGEGTLNILAGEFSIGADGGLGDKLILSVDRDGTAVMSDGDSAGALAGSGTVNIEGGTLELKDATAVFSGTFTGNGGTINHSGSGIQTINSVGSEELSITQSGSGRTVLRYEEGTALYDSLSVSGGILQIEGSIRAENIDIDSAGHLYIGKEIQGANRSILYSSNTTLVGGGQITFNGITRSTTDVTAFHAGEITHTGEGSTQINLSTTGDWTGSSYTINLIQGTGIDVGNYNATLLGALKNLGYDVKSLIEEDGILKAVVESSGKNGLLDFANSHNTVQAANSIWNARVESPEEGGILRDIINTFINSGSGEEGSLTAQEATAAFASYAGSSVTTLLSSQRDSLFQQVKWIRNRTTQMGVNAEYVNEDMPYFNAWIQGNGGYNKIQEQGDQAGYSLETWGGTFGVDVDLNEKVTVGAAFTASYNKIKTNSYDPAKGRNDGYYANLFARLQSGKWAHTLILTGGTNDASLNRTVNIGGSVYHSNGTTTGSSFGAYYEGSYDIALNERGTTILQPLFNASLYRSQMDGYTETGMGDASMKIDDMKASYGTVGLGTRLMSIVGTNVFGRGALGELRVQMVQDYGDRTDTAKLAPLGALSTGVMNVRGSRIGRTGVQVGAGISIPVGTGGSVYADVDADFRSRATVLSGNIGYRINF